MANIANTDLLSTSSVARSNTARLPVPYCWFIWFAISGALWAAILALFLG